MPEVETDLERHMRETGHEYGELDDDPEAFCLTCAEAAAQEEINGE